MKYKEFAEVARNLPYTEIEYRFAYGGSPGMVRKFPMMVTSFAETDGVIKLPEKVNNRWDMPVGLVRVFGNAFREKSGITDIILPSCVYEIDAGAFAGCKSLKRITIPRGVSRIAERTFAGCDSLEDVYFEGTVDEWKKTNIIHERHEMDFGDFIPGTPVQRFEGERMVHISGNDALFTANIHFRCDFTMIYRG